MHSAWRYISGKAGDCKPLQKKTGPAGIAASNWTSPAAAAGIDKSGLS
jgi:hypothetical protein